MAALQLSAVALVAGLAVKVPHYVLGIGIAGTLAGGAFSQFTYMSSLILLVGGCASVLALVSSRLRANVQRLALPLIVLLWLAFRVALEKDFSSATAAMFCVATLLLALHCIDSRRNVATALAISGIVFVTASALYGVDNRTGSRFEGVSGNPNRMTFGLLLYLPFLIDAVMRTRARFLRVLCLAAAVVAVMLVIQSGSGQGIVGLVIIVLILLLCWISGLPSALRVTALLASIAVLILVQGSVARAIQASPDLRGLSGRTSIYAAAVQDISRHPLVGSGQQHFSEGVVMERSAHSVILGLASTGGVLLALAWIGILVMLVTTAVAFIRYRSPLAAVPAVLIIEQLVQTVQLVPFTWAVVALFLLARSPTDLGSKLAEKKSQPHGPRSHPDHARPSGVSDQLKVIEGGKR